MVEIAIKGYIEKEIPELAGRLYPLHTTDLSKLNVVYTYTPISMVDTLARHSWSLRLLTKIMTSARELRKSFLPCWIWKRMNRMWLQAGISSTQN